MKNFERKTQQNQAKQETDNLVGFFDVLLHIERESQKENKNTNSFHDVVGSTS